MSKVCEICAKSTVAGKRIQHHHSIGWRFKAPKSLRVFKPNLRSVDLDVEGKHVKATVCMKCYKKLRSIADAEMAEVTAQAAAAQAKKAAVKAKAKTEKTAKVAKAKAVVAKVKADQAKA